MRGDRTQPMPARRDVLKLLGAGGLALMAALPAATRAATATPKRGGLYRLGRVQDVLNFNPSNLSQGNEPMLFQVYDTLVRIGDDFTLEPRLAESWRFSPDNLTVTLKLRQGVKYHTGRDFAAEDVLGTIAFYADKQNAPTFCRSPPASRAQGGRPPHGRAAFRAAARDALRRPGSALHHRPEGGGGLKNKPNGTGPSGWSGGSPTPNRSTGASSSTGRPGCRIWMRPR